MIIDAKIKKILLKYINEIKKFFELNNCASDATIAISLNIDNYEIDVCIKYLMHTNFLIKKDGLYFKK